jgi:hypothetical protein
MLRVRILAQAGETTLIVEGRVAGPWVEELAGCWAQARAGSSVTALHVDLDGATFISESGKALLAEIQRQGGVLDGHGCMTREIVEEITRRNSG